MLMEEMMMSALMTTLMKVEMPQVYKRLVFFMVGCVCSMAILAMRSGFDGSILN